MKLKADLTLRKVGSDYIIVQPDQGVADLSKVFSLNQTAAYIWEAVHDKEFDLAYVTRLLTDRFEVDQETASTDAERMVALFEAQNLLAED